MLLYLLYKPFNFTDQSDSRFALTLVAIICNTAIETSQIKAFHGLIGTCHKTRTEDSAKVPFPPCRWGLGMRLEAAMHSLPDHKFTRYSVLFYASQLHARLSIPPDVPCPRPSVKELSLSLSYLSCCYQNSFSDLMMIYLSIKLYYKTPSHRCMGVCLWKVQWFQQLH